MERETIRRIREAARGGRLPEPFTPEQVNKSLNIDWAGKFLPKHRVGNPGSEHRVGCARIERCHELFLRAGGGSERTKPVAAPRAYPPAQLVDIHISTVVHNRKIAPTGALSRPASEELPRFLCMSRRALHNFR